MGGGVIRCEQGKLGALMKTEDICDYGVCECSSMPDICLAAATSGVLSDYLSIYLSMSDLSQNTFS